MEDWNFQFFTITRITGKNDDISNIKPMEISKTMRVSIGMNGNQNGNTERIWACLKLQQLAKQI